MRAVLRYRRIPFHRVIRGSEDDRGIPEVPVALIPVLAFPDAAGTYTEAMIDSTFQIFSRERLPDTVRGLLAEVGRVYVPFLLANAAALERGDDQVRCEIEGRPWVQQPFPYQGKCLRWLREQYAKLGGDGRASVDRALAGTGCERLLESAREIRG
jgi:hypothetical protein